MSESLSDRHSSRRTRPKAPKSSKIPSSISDSTVHAYTSELEGLISFFQVSDQKSLEKVESLITRLIQLESLDRLDSESLVLLVSKLQESLTQSIDLKSSSSEQVSLITNNLAPARLYLAIVKCEKLDPRVYIDVILENILEFVKRACLIIAKSSKYKTMMSGLCPVLCNLIPLVGKCMIPDYWTISLTDYILKALFASVSMIQLPCAQLLSAILSSYPSQSVLIIDEIISNLPELTAEPNKALNNKSRKIHGCDYYVSQHLSIKFCNFLVLQIVQNNIDTAKAVKANGRLDFTEVLTVYNASMELMHYFVNDIIKKCWKGNTESVDYKICLEQFIEDILKVLYVPEFPFAHKFLHYIVVKFFVILNKQSHSAAIRQFAIDKLSVISRKVTADMREVKVQPFSLKSNTQMMKKINEKLEECSVCLNWVEPDLLEDEVCDNCRIANFIEDSPTETLQSNEEERIMLPKEIVRADRKYGSYFKDLVCNYLAAQPCHLFEHARAVWLSIWISENSEQQETINRLKKQWLMSSIAAKHLFKLTKEGTSRLLRQSLTCNEVGTINLHIQYKMFMLMAAPQPLFRSKALKGLTSIVEADPDILLQQHIQEAVTGRLLDSSVSVREAAVELLGKYVSNDTYCTDSYFRALLSRLKDKGPSVRKRVIICLKELVLSENERTVEILGELMRRGEDEVDSIRKEVVKTFSSIWAGEQDLRKLLLSMVKLIKTQPLKDPFVVLFKLIINQDSKFIDKLRLVTEVAIDQLYASDKPSQSLLYAKLLEVICMTEPALLTDYISTIHQLLTPNSNSSTNEESELLVIIGHIIEQTSPLLADRHLGCTGKIEKQLLGLIYTQGTAVVSSAVAALCNVCKCVSGDVNNLINLVRNCLVILKAQKQKRKIDQKIVPSIYRALLVLSLTLKHYSSDLYSIFDLEPGQDFSETIFSYICHFYAMDNRVVKNRALESLSAVWIRFPHLLSESAGLIKQAWEEASTSDAKLSLLKTFYEFLQHSDAQSADGNDTSSIFSIIQNYIAYINSLAKDHEQSVREAAVTVLRLIHLQGHINPTLYIGLMIALLADPSLVVRDAAFQCIEGLYQKNSSAVVVHVKQGILESYSYQLELTQSAKNTLENGEVVYDKLFSLVKKKKKTGLQFVGVLNNLFEPGDPSFTLYIAEMVSLISFGYSYELNLVVSHLDSKIDTAGHRILRDFARKKEKGLSEKAVSEALFIAQAIILKQYLSALYSNKAEEEENRVFRSHEYVQGFLEVYNEFYMYHPPQRLNSEALACFKRKVKCM